MFVALVGAFFVVGELVGSHRWVGILGAVPLLAFAWLLSPALFPASADLETAKGRAAEGEAPLVFWKPGCTYCILLRLRLGPAGRRVSWVDSSIDERARSLVRSVNGGNHTTPTVTFAEETRTNADAAWVRTLLR